MTIGNDLRKFLVVFLTVIITFLTGSSDLIQFFEFYKTIILFNNCR